jgi:hypothetical protein
MAAVVIADREIREIRENHREIGEIRRENFSSSLNSDLPGAKNLSSLNSLISLSL